MKKKCQNCGKFFEPDKWHSYQKICFNEECRKELKYLTLKKWRIKNPDYFKKNRVNNLEKVKEWRKRNPDYYKEYRKKNPIIREKTRKYVKAFRERSKQKQNFGL